MKKFLVALAAGAGLIVIGCQKEAEALDVDFVSDYDYRITGCDYWFRPRW